MTGVSMKNIPVSIENNKKGLTAERKGKHMLVYVDNGL